MWCDGYMDNVMVVVLVIVWWCGGDVVQWRYGGFGGGDLMW